MGMYEAACRDLEKMLTMPIKTPKTSESNHDCQLCADSGLNVTVRNGKPAVESCPVCGDRRTDVK